MPVLDTIVVEVIERGPQGPQVSDGDKGDISVSANGTNWQINVGAVANDRLAEMPEATIKGRAAGAGTGVAADLTAANARNVIGYISSYTVAEATKVSSSVNTIRVDGYATAGDGGGANYRRSASEPTHPGKLQTADGAWWEIAEAVIFPEMLGAPANGVDDDTTYFTAAMLVNRHVKGTPGKTYVLSDYTCVTNTTLDLTGCYVRRGAGAKRAIDIGAYHATVIGGDINGGGVWASTTVTAAASAGGSTIQVADASGLKVGMACVHGSNWRSGREINEITAIVGNTVSLSIPLRGNVAPGVPFLADYPLVRMSGPSLAFGSLRDMWVRNCLFGVQKGQTGIAGGNSFGTITNIRVSEFIGAGLLLMGNNAGEAITDFVLDGGRTQVANYVAAPGQTRFAYPWLLSKIPSRWGSERSIRITVNGVAVAAANYTIDTGAAEVVLAAAPPAGAAVAVINYEYAAFGQWSNSAGRVAQSSLERQTSGVIIAVAIGSFIESSELGFFSNIIADTCSYAAALVSNSSDIHFRASSFYFSPFGIIIDSTCSKCSVAAFETSTIGDSEEFTPTTGKKEVVVETGATDINIDFLSWTSTNYAADIPASTMSSNRRVALAPSGLFIGAPPSSALADIRTSGGANGLALTADGNTLNFGNSGYNYFQNGFAGATMRIGAVGASSSTEITCGSGVALRANPNGTLTTFANRINLGSDSGPQLWNGSVAPEGVVTAPVGSLYLRTNGGAGTTLYVKESGAGSMGWVAK